MSDDDNKGDDDGVRRDKTGRKIHAGMFVAGDARAYRGGGAVRKTKEGLTLPQLCRMHTEESVERLVEIIRNPKSKDRDVVSAITLMFSRGWGMPSQTLTVEGSINHQHTTATIDMSRLTADQCRALLSARVDQPEPILIESALKEPDGE